MNLSSEARNNEERTFTLDDDEYKLLVFVVSLGMTAFSSPAVLPTLERFEKSIGKDISTNDLEKLMTKLGGLVRKTDGNEEKDGDRVHPHGDLSDEG